MWRRLRLFNVSTYILVHSICFETLPTEASLTEDVRYYYDAAQLLEAKYRAILYFVIISAVMFWLALLGTILYCIIHCFLKHRRRKQAEQYGTYDDDYQ